jgi:capsular exopolysaccharide synthesis family protein
MQSSLGRYVVIAKRWAWLVILGVVICGGLTFIVSKLMHPVYTASAILMLDVSGGSSPAENTTAALTLQTSFSPLVTNAKVLEPVASKYGMTLAQLNSMVKVTPVSNTVNIEVDVSAGDPNTAANIANAIGSSFQQYMNNLEGGTVQVNIVQAVPPANPSRPQPTQDAMFGALAGLGLSIALIVLFEWIDDRLAGPEDVRTLLSLDPLTVIPELSAQQRTKNAEDTPALAEGCRILCANLNMAQAIHPFKMVMVTSALAGEGKSTIAANIASFLAMSGKRVLLVDADMRHPVLDQHFQLDNRKGLSSAFLEPWPQVQMELDGKPTEIPSLRVLTTGVLPSNPPELLQSHLAHQLFNHFRNAQQFDYIIFDTPPLLPVADAQILAAYIQTTVLVVDASKTSRKMLRQARQTLSRTSTRVIGVAINKSPWPGYGDIQDYLSNVQQRPRADIAVSTPPPNMMQPVRRANEVINTAIMPTSNNNSKR